MPILSGQKGRNLELQISSDTVDEAIVRELNTSILLGRKRMTPFESGLLYCWDACRVLRCLSCLARRVETWNFRYRRTLLMKRSFHEKSRQSTAAMTTGMYPAVEGLMLRQTIYISRNTLIRAWFKFPRYDAHRIPNGNTWTLEINLSNTAPARLQRDLSACPLCLQ
ncbi:hypothetical protein PILCRDRAFT_501097 [Piloderma croceum F 1598]|uniref:Uncharacterized protein n=1 Tax=Piloderma croceum (strain F 1598) TaxID=765440 RepID=A0A0C3F9T0_PILCF|nr:hypothetical protein PILCRDRAFT_501097 [Piloderma croceum F 1598]